MTPQSIAAYAALAVAIISGAFLIFSELNTPEYRVVTEKPIFGNSSSPVTVVEFGDIECPACKAANLAVQQLKEKYKDQVQFKYMHLPLNTIHKSAQRAAEAIECANDHGKFFEYIDEAYIMSPDLSRSDLIGLAQRIGIDKGNFTACINSGFKAAFVEADLREGQRRGVAAIPAFFINDRLAQEHSFAVLSNMIDEELGKGHG